MPDHPMLDASWPPSVQAGLERFCIQMQEVLGEELISLLVYGERAGGWPGAAKVEVLVVLRSASIEILESAAQPVQEGISSCGLSALILTEEDLQNSTDVFPIKFLNIQRNHKVLFGTDPVSSLTISREHLRLRAEQELKNLMMRLNRFYLERNAYPEQVEITLTRAVSAFLQSLSILVELKTGTIPGTWDQAVELASKVGLDGQVLEKVLAVKSGEFKPEPDALKSLYAEFMLLVRQAAVIADQHEENV